MFKIATIGFLAIELLLFRAQAAQFQQSNIQHEIKPGDTWIALGYRYGIEPETLQRLSNHPNQTRQPVIGTSILLPMEAEERHGRLIRVNEGGLLQTSVIENKAPWELATTNSIANPYTPSLFQALYISGGDGYPIDLPPGVQSLEVAQLNPRPGQALGLRGRVAGTPMTLDAEIDGTRFVFANDGDRFVGIAGTGAFYQGGQPELTIKDEGLPAWNQPWQFAEKEWDYQSLTLTGEAAEIDQQARDEERERLRAFWTTITPEIRWTSPFRLPIEDYLEMSATYGGRRSYNGGPFLTYHEGVDFSAYAGTPVFAPAAGIVVVAEPLYVRGGAIVIDHGLGLYSGYYHLSAIDVVPGQTVQPGDLLGGVGTTGLSTGNHLHWDLLVNGIWIDAMSWLDQDMACWLREGLDLSCQPLQPEL